MKKNYKNLKPKDYDPIPEDQFKKALQQVADKGKVFYGDPKDPTKEESNRKFKVQEKQGKFTVLEE